MAYISDNEKESNKLLERFIKYVKIWSESDGAAADSGIFPSTERQWDMAKNMESELLNLGLMDVQITDKCYVYGRLPATKGSENKPSILLLAHMDTVDEVTAQNVNPQIFHNYDGQLIELACGVIHDISKDKYLFMAAENRETIITTDGNTLLGGDDKAGIAAIMQALEYLCENKKLSHGDVEVIFSPDEETGHGMDFVPMNLIKSRFAYTVDGGHIGELESECFNAYSASISFTGKACHTGSAKEGKMINAATMAAFFASNLPRHLSPETTEMYEPFIALMEMNGSIESAKISLLLRAFSMKEIEEEKEIICAIAESVKKTFGGNVEVSFKQQYVNMKEKLDENPQVVERLLKAFDKAGIKAVQNPIRGGTDGSRLTEMGIPTPNIFTGAHNFHSRSEWVSLNQMAKASDILLNLLTE